MIRRNRFADLHRRLIACPGHNGKRKTRFQRIEGILRVLGRTRPCAAATASRRTSVAKSSAQSQQSVKESSCRVSDGEFARKFVARQFLFALRRNFRQRSSMIPLLSGGHERSRPD
jgi:hypothetical protein